MPLVMKIPHLQKSRNDIREQETGAIEVPSECGLQRWKFELNRGGFARLA